MDEALGRLAGSVLAGYGVAEQLVLAEPGRSHACIENGSLDQTPHDGVWP